MKKVILCILILFLWIGFTACFSGEIVCHRCKKENESESVYCVHCKWKLSEHIICPECNTQNQNGSSYCKKCGEAISAHALSIDFGDINVLITATAETTTTKVPETIKVPQTTE